MEVKKGSVARVEKNLIFRRGGGGDKHCFRIKIYILALFASILPFFFQILEDF
jgi:hypothetical protein